MKKILLTGSTFLMLFLSCAQNTVTDADGNTYHTVKIGNQVWTAENFRATKFNDGTSIPHVPDSVAWPSLITPGYCYYGNTNNADTIKKFGAFYNWHCVDSEKFALPGWHVATDDDWDTLQNYLIKHGYNWDGVKRDNRIAKSMAARSGWKPFGIKGMPGNNMKNNNRSSFSGFATGFRTYSQDSTGCHAVFQTRGHLARWWSATKINESSATVYGMGYCVEGLIKYERMPKSFGYPVRLVKN